MSARITARTLGIEFTPDPEKGLFLWLLASFLIGKRIQADIAVDTWRVIVERHGRDTPLKLGQCTHRELVAMLGEGHYTRYDESTAERLLALVDTLKRDYHGQVSGIYRASADRHDVEKRLLAFKGIGPKTVEIFMREAAGVLY
ncbi:DNA methylase [Pseudomonas syringae]|nr:DNA methylase [Pseudomonas syringae]MBD8790353.1 DNA methylase [Pseudomonas syringae]MBD8799149.1 DNA methylase [Pseudomonas syringae]MBD8809975.1 DNA methylase [Pseudomonas syringae]